MLVLEFQSRFKSFQAIQGTKTRNPRASESEDQFRWWIRFQVEQFAGLVWQSQIEENPGSKVSKLFEIQTL